MQKSKKKERKIQFGNSIPQRKRIFKYFDISRGGRCLLRLPCHPCPLITGLASITWLPAPLLRGPAAAGNPSPPLFLTGSSHGAFQGDKPNGLGIEQSSRVLSGWAAARSEREPRKEMGTGSGVPPKTQDRGVTYLQVPHMPFWGKADMCPNQEWNHNLPGHRPTLTTEPWRLGWASLLICSGVLPARLPSEKGIRKDKVEAAKPCLTSPQKSPVLTEPRMKSRGDREENQTSTCAHHIARLRKKSIARNHALPLMSCHIRDGGPPRPQTVFPPRGSGPGSHAPTAVFTRTLESEGKSPHPAPRNRSVRCLRGEGLASLSSNVVCAVIGKTLG